MAVNHTDLKNKLAARANGQSNAPPSAQTITIKALFDHVDVRKRFEDILGKNAPGFISSVISVINGNAALKKADPMTVISAAAVAAALDLPVDPNLGFAYIVPYKGRAQFQMGYKGYIQLAMRTGQYKTINACEVYEGEIESINRFTGEIIFGEKKSDAIVGYIAYFRLLNGFEKYLYMTVDEIRKHARKYSQSYSSENSRWQTDFHAMALKTVLKRILSKYGILSIKMQMGVVADQAVINQDEEGNHTYEYPDGVGPIDVEYIEPEEEAAPAQTTIEEAANPA